MNWFDLRDLENRLVESKVSEKEGFYYLLANLILFGLASYGTVESYNHGAFLFVEITVMVLITIVGLNYTFKANKSGDGQDYFKRFLSLYFVIGIRLALFIILLALPAGFLGYFIFGGEISNKTTQDLLYISFLSACMILYYYLLVRSFKKVAHYKSGGE